MKDQKEVAKSEFAIVNEVAVMLNLGDFGKVESFVRKASSILKREVDTAERSIINEKHNTKSKLDDMQEKLEDAQQSVSETYTNLDPKDLKTNDAQREHAKIYFAALDKAEGVVKGIEDKIAAIKETSDNKVKSLNDEIAVRKTRINRLTKGEKTQA